MFDDLRDMSGDEGVFDNPDIHSYDVFGIETEAPERRFLGMTAAQRLVISLLLLGTVAVVGLMFLLVFEKVWPY